MAGVREGVGIPPRPPRGGSEREPTGAGHGPRMSRRAGKGAVPAAEVRYSRSPDRVQATVISTVPLVHVFRRTPSLRRKMQITSGREGFFQHGVSAGHSPQPPVGEDGHPSVNGHRTIAYDCLGGYSGR